MSAIGRDDARAFYAEAGYGPASEVRRYAKTLSIDPGAGRDP